MEHAAAPYPVHWEADVLLRDGSTTRLRPIRTEDAAALQAFHVAQSEQSTYFRFFAPLRRLPERDLARLVTVDHVDRVALVAVQGEAIIAVGRYDRIAPDTAEVAFNVSDAQQGRGLGSVLLEHLAAAARERGVRKFVADVLPGNAKMIRVFTDAGYDVVQRYEDGVISLEFTIEATERSLAVVASREQRTDAASLRAFLAPHAVLVVAGHDPLGLATQVVESVGYGRSQSVAPVWCVGPALQQVAAQRGYRWVAEVRALGPMSAAASETTTAQDGGAAPGGGDLTDVAIPATAELAVVSAAAAEVMALLPELAACGVRGVVLLGSGFGEPAAPTQRELVAEARSLGLRLVGPRSFGVLARGAAGDLNLTLDPTLPLGGSLAFFSHSRAIAYQAGELLSEHRLGLAAFISAGHRADVSGNDLLQYAAELDGVGAVGLYLETLGNPRKFARVVSRVSATVPVVAVLGAAQRDAGLSRAALQEAMTTAGVVVAPSLRALVETTQLLISQPLPTGSRLAVVSDSSSLLDIALAQVHPIDPDPVRCLLPWGERGEAVTRPLADLAQQEWDVALVLYSPPLGRTDPAVLQQIAALGAGSRTVLAVVPGLVGLTPDLTAPSGQAVPAYRSVEDAVSALGRTMAYAQWRRLDRGGLVEPEGMDLAAARGLVEDALAPLLAEGEDATVTSRVRLTPRHTYRFLLALGIETMPARKVRTTGQAVAVARTLGWPVAVKSTDERLRHRADLGGVRLDVAGPIELVDAVRQIRQRQGGDGPVLVQRMAPLGVACLVQVRDDPVLGPLVSFGLSGDAVELLEDATYALPPLRTADVHRLVHGIRAAPRLLRGIDGSGVDVAGLEDMVARLAVAVEAIPQLRLLRLHPALASPTGVVALEGTVEVAPQVRPDGSRRSLRS